jgi:hypothetical protein
MILFGERSLRRAMKEYVEHYHTERNHQGKGNVLLFQRVTEAFDDPISGVAQPTRPLPPPALRSKNVWSARSKMTPT